MFVFVFVFSSLLGTLDKFFVTKLTIDLCCIYVHIYIYTHLYLSIYLSIYLNIYIYIYIYM